MINYQLIKILFMALKIKYLFKKSVFYIFVLITCKISIKQQVVAPNAIATEILITNTQGPFECKKGFTSSFALIIGYQDKLLALMPCPAQGNPTDFHSGIIEMLHNSEQ